MWIKCSFKNIKNVIIGNFYRPPKGNKNNFINYLTDLSETLKSYKDTEIFCLGDFNICLVSA